MARFGENALQVINNVKQRIEEIKPGLPAGVDVVPVYDRSELIHAAIATLTDTLVQESAIVALVCWVQPLWDQFFGLGNLGKVLGAGGAGDAGSRGREQQDPSFHALHEPQLVDGRRGQARETEAEDGQGEDRLDREIRRAMAMVLVPRHHGTSRGGRIVVRPRIEPVSRPSWSISNEPVQAVPPVPTRAATARNVVGVTESRSTT